mmetsp:Transcript_17976/g.26758  ORF Transcript_17976/g.26758 Transcript_17976/m.26758 type:complete len:208 (+) Transcript_17976:1096-1719(+)
MILNLHQRCPRLIIPNRKLTIQTALTFQKFLRRDNFQCVFKCRMIQCKEITKSALFLSRVGLQQVQRLIGRQNKDPTRGSSKHKNNLHAHTNVIPSTRIRFECDILRFARLIILKRRFKIHIKFTTRIVPVRQRVRINTVIALNMPRFCSNESRRLCHWQTDFTARYLIWKSFAFWVILHFTRQGEFVGWRLVFAFCFFFFLVRVCV